jgi:hypothetical protein
MSYLMEWLLLTRRDFSTWIERHSKFLSAKALTKEVICLDIGSCEVLSPIKQLINFLSAVDQRLKKLSEQTFLQAMIAIATNEAMLLHMHRGLEKFCDQYDGMDQEDVEALKNASN